MIPSLDFAACTATAWQATPDMALRSGIAAGLLAVAGWATARRRFPGQPSFIALCGVMAAWLLFSVTEHAAVAPACKATLALSSWLAIMAQPVAYALFLHQYIHSDFKLPPQRILLPLLLPSAGVLLLVLGNGWHGLVYGPASDIGPVVLGIPRMRYDYQPLFYLAITLNYAWVLGASVLVARAYATAHGRLRRQWAAFLLMSAVPLAANVAYLLGHWTLWGTDPTSTGFAAALVGFAWMMQRDRMFAVVPVARRLLFDELPDPVIVLDADGRIAELNGAARRLAPSPAPLERSLTDWPGLGEVLVRHLAAAGAPGAAEAPLAVDDPPAWYEVHRREIGRAGQPIGTLLQLHDVSTRHQAHAEAVRTLAEREIELDKATALQGLLREQAMHDPLTGLLNRRALAERHAHETHQRLRPLALVLMDLDHFKRINDAHGHAVGDAVLRDFAAALRSGLRASDALFRIGGEEFVLLMPGATGPEAERRIAALRTLVSRWQLGGLPTPVTFSAGIAVAHHADAPDALELLLAAADEALYAAKRNGRNRSETAADGA